MARQERELRAALDRTFVILGAAENRKQTLLIAHLEEMRREVVHLTMRLIALNTSLEAVMSQGDFARCLPVADSVLKALSDAARSVGLTLIMYRAENFAAANLRWRRCEHLIAALEEQLATLSVGPGHLDVAQVLAALDRIKRGFPRLQEVLHETADHRAPRQRFMRLPDISALSIQSLGEWMRPADSLDPILVRYALRMAVFTMFAVGLYKGFGIPRGYWIAFTIMVVLQPDYGSTRQRAGERISGTIAGSLIASLLLWVTMPLYLLDGFAIVTALLFAYYLKRSYGKAIFFVTINIVLITETIYTVHHDFMVMRVLSTLLGGGLALVAARVFWPVWESEKYPELLAAAIRANHIFLQNLANAFAPPLPAPPAGPNLLMVKRRAENANRFVAASVERLLGEPVRRQETPERAATLATYNQRVTRALTALAVHVPETGRMESPALYTLAIRLGHLLEQLARAVEQNREMELLPELESELIRLEKDFAATQFFPDAGATIPSPPRLIWEQFAKTLAEIRAMTLALKMTT